MNIEFYTPTNQIGESLVAKVRDAILNLHKLHPSVLRAEVSFRQRRKVVTTEKICEIRFFISGNVNLLSGSADSYDKAAIRAIQKLEDALSIYFKKHPEPVVAPLTATES